MLALRALSGADLITREASGLAALPEDNDNHGEIDALPADL